MGPLTRFSNDGSQRILFAVLTVLLFAAFAVQLVYHAVRTSATVDEPFHILAGHRHWQCGDFGINPEHPPLLKVLATAPLNFRQLSEPPWECGSKLTPKFDGFSYGSTFIVKTNIALLLLLPLGLIYLYFGRENGARACSSSCRRSYFLFLLQALIH